MSFRYSTTSAKPPYTAKNHKGASFKHVPKRNDASMSGGGTALHVAVKRIGIKPGIGLPKGKGAVAYEKKNSMGSSYKTVAPRGESDGGAGSRLATATGKAIRGKRLDSWARGARKNP